MSNLFLDTQDAYYNDVDIPDSTKTHYLSALPNERRKILSDYLKGLSQKQTEPGKRESMSDDADTLIDESEDLRQNKVKNRMQSFKDQYDLPDMNDFEFEQFMNNSGSDINPKLKGQWFNDTLETRKGKETYANRLHTMNLHANSLYNRTTPIESPLDYFSQQGAENIVEKLGGLVGLPYLATENDAEEEGIDSPYLQNPFLSIGKDLVNGALLIGAPEIRGFKLAQGLKKGAAVGTGAGLENSFLGTEAEDYKHNPHLIRDKVIDTGIGGVAGGALGGLSNVAGGIKAIPGKVKGLFSKGIDKLHTEKENLLSAVSDELNSSLGRMQTYKEQAAKNLAHNPTYINANPEDRKNMFIAELTKLDKSAKEEKSAQKDVANLFDESEDSFKNYVQDQVNKQYGHNPFLHVSPSKVIHNVPYYIAGNNPDFSEYVATKSVPKMLNKVIPGVEKVPYYLEKQE